MKKKKKDKHEKCFDWSINVQIYFTSLCLFVLKIVGGSNGQRNHKPNPLSPFKGIIHNRAELKKTGVHRQASGRFLLVGSKLL